MVMFGIKEIKKKKLKIDKNKLIFHILPLPSNLELKIVSGGPKGTEIIAEIKDFEKYLLKCYKTETNTEILKEYKTILEKYKSGKYRIHVYWSKFEIRLLDEEYPK